MIQLEVCEFGLLMFLFGMSVSYSIEWILDKLGRECE